MSAPAASGPGVLFSPLEPRLLLSDGVFAADAGADQTVDEADVVSFSGSFIDTRPGGTPGEWQVSQLTDGSAASDAFPDIDGTRAVWREEAATGTEIYLYDGSSVQLVAAAGTTRKLDPLIDGDSVLYRDPTSALKLYDAAWNTTTPIPAGGGYKIGGYDLDGDLVAWREANNQIYCYDVGQASPASTPVGTGLTNPKVSGDTIVFIGSGGLVVYDVTAGSAVTLPPGPAHLDDANPQVAGSNVVWQAREISGGDFEIFLYDGVSVQQLTSNSTDDVLPQVSEDLVAWIGQDAGQSAVFLYPLGGGGPQVVAAPGSPQELRVSGTNAVWYEQTGSLAWDIFFCDASAETPASVVVQSPVSINSRPAVSGANVAWLGQAGSSYDVFLGIAAAPQTYTFAWDFGDEGTAEGTLTPEHVYADDGVYTVTLTVTDGAGISATDTAAVTVNNVAPTAVDDGYATNPLDMFEVLSVSAEGVLANDTDPAGTCDPLEVTSTGALATTLGAAVVMNADGGFSYDAAASGILLALADGETATDTFSYEISDGDGGTAAGVVTVTVTGTGEGSVHVIDCPCGDGTRAVVVKGSSLDDKIDVNLGSLAGELKVRIKTGSMAEAVDMGAFKYDGSEEAISKVIVYGLDGSDEIKVHSQLDVAGWLFGGGGDDMLRGGKGNDVLVGGQGDDKLHGQQGRDLLIGGLGADKIHGNADEDILVAGATSYDSNLAALCAIMAEWTSEADFAARVAHITGPAGGLNGSYFLNADAANGPVTVFDDGSEDSLRGGDGADWLMANLIGSGVQDKLHLDAEDIFTDLELAWMLSDPAPDPIV